MSPVSNPVDFTITSNADGLTPVRDLGGVVFLLDAIAAMTGNGVNLTGFSDRSGNGCACTIGTAPQFTATKWGGVLPAAQFVRTSSHHLRVTLPSIPQPFTLFSVIDGYIGDGDAAGNANLINPGIGISYRISTSNRWSLFAGIPVQTNIVASASTGKVIRFDVFNGVNSQSFRSGTASALVNAGALASDAGLCGIGARNDGVDASAVILAGCGMVSHALDATERALLLAFYTARYPGISAT